MKKLLVILCVILAIQVHGQDTSKKDTSSLTLREFYTDAKSGFKDVIAGIKDLASKLEGPAKHVYEIYTRQYRAEGWAHLLCGIFIFLLGGIIILRNWSKAEWYSHNWNRSATMSLVGIAVFAVSCIVVTAFFGGSGLTKIINPEYYAIQDIIQNFK